MTEWNKYDRKVNNLDRLDKDKVMACNTVPELLTLNYGNMSDCARYLECYRATIRRVARDVKGDNHRVVRVGDTLKLMTAVRSTEHCD